MSDLTLKTSRIKNQLKNGLIVSCQAPKDSPLYNPEIIAAFALCAEKNGAAAVRIDSPEHISAVKKLVSFPVLGIYKIVTDESGVYITPTFDSARQIAEAGADIIALDATLRMRPGNENLQNIVEQIHAELKLPVMADVATFEEGLNAAAIGFDFIGTTLSGYTPETSRKNSLPDFELVKKLSDSLSVPVICEGRLRSPQDMAKAFEYGAFSAVVGNAITGLDRIIGEYVQATPKHLITSV